jgi:DNA-binding transcriptional LysR family regulator
MDLEQIERFLAVVKYKSFTHAANSIFISVSTLSKSVSDLEAEMGGLLFNRLRGAVTMTERGEILFEGAEAIMRKLTELESMVRHHESASLFHLTVSRWRMNTKMFWN